MPDNETNVLEERLRQLNPRELLEIIRKSLNSNTLTDEQRKELQEATLMLAADIKENEEILKRHFNEKGREILELISRFRDDDTLSEDLRQRLETLADMIAGYLLHAWLPRGLIRKILMFLFLVIGIIGIVKWNLWFGIFILLSAGFSPRIAGEVAYFFGSLSTNETK